jgi:EAL domain-containing protein (putative c-di-GMP-specific phosphodiesterase class I)
MESNPDYESVVHAIITLAHHMEVAVVAEGVELFEHWDSLRNLGCDYVQGFYFSKSLSAEAATRWIVEKSSCGIGSPLPQLQPLV